MLGVRLNKFRFPQSDYKVTGKYSRQEGNHRCSKIRQCCRRSRYVSYPTLRRWRLKMYEKPTCMYIL